MLLSCMLHVGGSYVMFDNDSLYIGSQLDTSLVH